MDGEKPPYPDLSALANYRRNTGALSGIWPSSPELSRAMLESYADDTPKAGSPDASA
jgi:hypothetical protein